MWIHNLALLLLVGLSLAQEEAASGQKALRRLRLRRPRPTPLISDPDGIAEGNPIPLRRIPQGVPVDQLVNERQNTADLLAAALDAGSDDDLQFEQGQSLQSTDALQSLLAVAEGPGPEPFIPEYDDIIEEQLQPIAAVPQRRPAPPVQQEAPRGRVPSGRTRRPPGVPRRTRPRPDNEEKGQRQPNRPAGGDTVGTVERYSHTNEDGSFTFGYIGEDGSFREETRGVDCITRGKYGYIDPDGKKREFTYVSGLPCDITDEETDEDLQREDPINPDDRFRTSAAVQLSQDQIPDSARPRQRIPAAERPIAPPQQPQRRPAPQPQPRPQQQPQQQFSSFLQQAPQQPRQPPAQRVRDPALLNRAPAGVQPTGAFQNLLNIVNDQEPTPIPPVTRPPRPQTQQPAVTRPRPQPQTPRPSPQSPPRPSSFNFDSELDSFTLNKPAITFDAAPEQEAAAKPNFSTELVFDPASGTFKTELRQALPGGEEVRVSNDAAPSGAAPAPSPSPSPTPAPTPSALPPTGTPFTAFSPTTLRPTTPRPPQSPRPSPTPSPSPSPRPTQPAAPSPSSPFTPLTFPSPAPTTPRPATVSTLAPERPRAAQQGSPRPTLAASPSPRPTSAVPSPTPRPTTLAASPRPTSPTPGNPPSNSFFFQPFPTVGSPRPITATSPAPGQPRPAIGQPQRLPANAGAPAGFPAGTFPITTQPGQPQARPQLPPGFNGQPLGQPQARPPPPGFPQNTQFIQQPRPGTPAPASAASPSPRPQQPTQARPVPFTVFNTNFQPTQNLRPAGVPEAPRAAQGTPAPAPTPTPARASPTPVVASPTPVVASPRPVVQAASPSPRPGTPAPSPFTPQVQFGFQPIQAGTPQPAQRPVQVSPQPQRPPPGFAQQPQRPPPGFAQQPPRPQPPRPAGQSRPFTAFASGPPPQLTQQFGTQPQRPGFFGQPQATQAQRPQQLGIPPQLAAQQQQPGGRFQPFGRPPPQGAPQRPQGPPQQRPPSSPFAVFNPSLLRGARLF